ncbi:ribonuclease HI family protein [Halogeometricum salsisoli]|uniref:ribonuclease HI family protein n=1 Tax=Halogeometricum salsisoli TaxID=2950536 RepID=UPI003CCD91FC
MWSKFWSTAEEPAYDVTLNFAGACRDNSGPSSYGLVLQRSGERTTYSGELGVSTSSGAEFRALIFGLKKVLVGGASHLQVRGSSEVVLRPLQGEYQMPDGPLWRDYYCANWLIRQLDDVEITCVPAHLNREATRLAEDALDDHF